MKVPDEEWEYDSREFGAGVDYKIETHTGLIGVFILFITVMGSAITVLFSSVFILFGWAEIITKTPTQWRVRWRRKPLGEPTEYGR